MKTRFDIPGGLIIGRNSIINRGCRLDSRGCLTIGDNVSISQDVCILTASHDVQSAMFEGYHSPVFIENYVFVGTRAMILPGVRIGRGAVVGAGSVVTRNVEPHQIVAGVPARVIGTRSSELRYELSYRRFFQ